MKAILQDVYGPPAVLHLGDAEEPVFAASDAFMDLQTEGFALHGSCTSSCLPRSSFR